MKHIEGQSRHQASLFPECLDDFIPADHAVRVIDAFVDSLDMAGLGFMVVPATTGRPGYHPAVLLKLYVYGYLNQLRSSRRLERECTRNVELLWLMQRLTPSFMTIASFRADHGKSLVAVCRSFIQFCRGQDLFGGQLVAIDGTKVEAVASRKQVWHKAQLQKRERELDEKIASYLAGLDQADAQESETGKAIGEAVTAALAKLRSRRDEIGARLQVLEAEGVSQRVATEPEARLMRTAQGYQVSYNAQIAVDAQHHLVVDTELTAACNDHNQLAPMALAVKAALQTDDLTVVADSGYANGEQGRLCTDNGITPVVPRPAVVNPGQDDYYTRKAFHYDAETDRYRCPAGEWLEPHRRDLKRQEVQYWNREACGGCPLRSRCTKGNHRMIVRSNFEADMAAMDERAKLTPELMELRRNVVEHPFGTIKWLLGRPRFLVRGLAKAQGEWALAVLGYNLKRVMAIMGVPQLLEALRQLAVGRLVATE